jgi:hypothetical protein
MRQTALLLGLLMVAACGKTDQQKTVDLLHQRLYESLADAAQAGAVTVQYRPDGAEIVFPEGGKPFTPDPRASMVEAMIDPSLLRIGIAAPAGLPPYEADRRVQAWTEDFGRMPLGGAQQAPAPQAVPSGMAVTLQVICPHRHDDAGFAYGVREPGCF